MKFAWIRLSAADSYSVKFWDSFVRGQRSWNGELADTLSHMPLPEGDAALGQFFLLLADALQGEQKVVIALENVHLLTPGPVTAFVERLCGCALERLRVLLISCRELTVYGPGMTGGQRLQENPIRLSPREVRMFCAAMGAPLTAAQAKEVHRLTGGRTYAVYLVGKCLPAGAPDPLEQGLPMLYLLLNQLYFLPYPHHLRTLLLRLSLLDWFSPGLAQAVSAADTAGLQELLEEHPFINPRSPGESWSFQPLFHEFLQRKNSLLSQHSRLEVYRSAARWCRQQGHYSEAIGYYRQCRSWEAMYLLIRSHHSRLLPEAENRRYLALLRQIPGHYTAAHPMVRVTMASLHLCLMEAGCAYRRLLCLCRELEALPAPSAEEAGALGEAYLLLAVLALSRRRQDFVALFRRAAALVEEGSVIIRRDTQFPGSNNAIILSGPEPGRLEEMRRSVFAISPYFSRMMNGCGVGMEYLASAEACYYTGDFEQAGHDAYQAIHRATAADQWDVVCGAYYVLLRRAFGAGRYQELLEVLDSLLESAGRAHLPMGDIAQSWLSLRLGQPEEISPWILQGPLRTLEGAPLFPGRARVICAGQLYATRQYGRLTAYLDASQPLLKRRGQAFMDLKLQIIRALGLDAQNRRRDAARALARAHHAAVGNGIITPFVELGRPMRTLAEHLLHGEESGIPRNWLETVLTKSSTYAKYHAALIRRHRELHAPSSPLSALSPRERGLLDGLCQGLTREELAAEAGLSINTVKSVLKHVYQKLGATNRADAVRIASGMAKREEGAAGG